MYYLTYYINTLNNKIAITAGSPKNPTKNEVNGFIIISIPNPVNIKLKI